MDYCIIIVYLFNVLNGSETIFFVRGKISKVCIIHKDLKNF